MNKILVTGGSGFLGRYLIKKLLVKDKELKIRTISRNENDTQRILTMCDSERLKPIIGDIRDIDVVKYALRGVDTVVHLAAMKHIDFCEMYPLEAFSINVVGTLNLLKFFGGNTFLAMSTDKAAEATSCYGATKLLMEKLVLGKASEDKSRRYVIVRSGNIFGSSGSVIEKWRQQVNDSNEIIATDLNMTRFFIDVNTLADFIIDILEEGKTGNIYIPFQKAIKLEDLAKAVIELNGNKNTRIKSVGLRKGEKLHEKLFSAEDNVITSLQDSYSQNVEKLGLEEIKSLLKTQ
ncbi:polysaccharide biosynthesis protein [Chloroflexota bacterium]